MAGERILVIDDSPTITKVVQLVLTKAGFEVDTAPDDEAGLAAVRAPRPDLILLDFVMPKMNGYQFCRELTADPKVRDVPVVLMSAKGDQVGERFVKVMGIVDYITKPFSPEAITAVVQHAIAKYSNPTNDDALGQAASDDLTDNDEADRMRARQSAFDQLRGHVADVVGARVAALIQLAASSESADSAVSTDAGSIAETVRKALDDNALSQLMSSVDLSLFSEGMPG